ncbi:MAG: DUF3987 domain-containing protein [Acidimicrobiia bacterium]
MAKAVPDFVDSRIVGGLASGEGLVADLARRSLEDRSVLVVEPEFARLLRVGARSASLSALVREAWDSTDLNVLTRHKPLRVRDANVSVLGHVTAEELRRRLCDTEITNGLANRFLFCWVERARRLPDGGTPSSDVVEDLSRRIGDAVAAAQRIDHVTRTAEASRLWAAIYGALDDDVEGVVGSLTARAEAQIVRLSVVYALLDQSPVVDVPHLDAAKAVWDHCEASVVRVFGGERTDERIARRLLAALRESPSGLDGTEQRDLFSRHVSGHEIAAARRELAERGLAVTRAVNTGGRPRLVTSVIEAALEMDSSLSSQGCAPLVLGSDK